MDETSFSRPSGTLLQRISSLSGRPYVCFVPNPLPPPFSDAELGALAAPLAAASRAFGELAGIGRLLPDPDLLVRPYMRQEAILSSRIENTYTSFSELVAFETTGFEGTSANTREVLNYVQAIEFGLRRVREEGITLDLVRDIHRILIGGTSRSTYATPGEIRSVQNHIGGGTSDPADARYVPPPPEEAAETLDQLIAYVEAEKPGVPVLIEAAWVHYQFEAIHPFLDGNGRVGRVLIPLLFAHRHQMDHPLLYLSPYFERDRGNYYDNLFNVSARSEWSIWLRYFLEGVSFRSRAAISLSSDIIELGQKWHRALDLSNASRSAHRLADLVHRHVAVTAKMATHNLEVAPQTAYNAIKALVETGILREFAERSWRQVFVAPELLALLEPAGDTARPASRPTT
jgi:Fic family protein